MRRSWPIIAALGLGLSVLGALATGCHERGREVEVYRERPEHDVYVERDRDRHFEREHRDYEHHERDEHHEHHERD
jgi:hypothetical protein